MKTLTKETAYKILKTYGTPDHVIAHCEAVGRVARLVGERLNQKDFHLDVQLAECAGLLHDMARLEENHQDVAAAYLREHGYDKAADIIAVHMVYPQFSKATETNETDLVCLGDRVCLEDKYVGVEKRFDYIFKKNDKQYPERHQILLEKKAHLLQYVKELESLIGISLDELCR